MAGTPSRAGRSWRGAVIAALLVVPTLVVVPFTAAPAAAAIAGDLDTSFSGDGYDRQSAPQSAAAVALQADGKSVVVGEAPRAGGGTSLILRRYNTDGTPDLSFGDAGLVVTNTDNTDDHAQDVVIQPDGRIVVALAGGGNMIVARFNPDGTYDTTFNATGYHVLFPPGGVSGANAVALQSDGSIVVVGYESDVAPATNSVTVARLSPSGALDASFGSGGFVQLLESLADNEARDVAIDAAGALWIAGVADANGFLAKLLPNGAPDSSVGGGDGVITDPFDTFVETFDVVAIQPIDGKVVVAGASDRTDHMVQFVFRYLGDGSLDSGFGIDGRYAFGQVSVITVNDVAVDSTGRVLVGGSNGPPEQPSDASLQRLTAAGESDTTFGNVSSIGLVTNRFGMASASIGGIAVAANDDVIAVGDGPGESFIARYLGEGSAPVDLPAIAGDGIAYATSHGPGATGLEIWVARPDGTAATRLTGLGAGPNSDPVWSPDGRRLAYVSQRDGTFNAEIYVYDLVTGVETDLLGSLGDGSYDADPAWSPDGTKIAFASDRDQFAGEAFNIYEVEVGADGAAVPGTLTSLTPGTTSWDSFPAYAPDGSIVFQSNRDGDDEIFHRGGGIVTQLTFDSDNDGHPAVSPDGSTVAFTDAGMRVSTVSITGGPIVTITPAGAADITPDWSPDGSEIVLQRTQAGATNLVATQPTGEGARVVAPTSTEGSEPHWFASLSLTTSTRTVQATPSTVPFGEIPTQPDSPAVADAIATGGLQITPGLIPLQITPGLIPLQITPGLIGLQITPGLIPLQILPGLIPLQITPGLIGLQITPGLIPLQITPGLIPAAIERLDRVPFGSVTFRAPSSAEEILAGSPFVGRPFHEFSLHDVATDSVAGPRLQAVPFSQIDLTAALGDVGLGTLLLGDTTFADISSPAIDVCATLAGLGYPEPCGGPDFAAPTPNGPDARNALGARPVDLAIAQVPFTDEQHPLNLHLVKMGEINLDPAAALLDFSLARLDVLRTTNFGSIRVAALPASTLADPTLLDCGSDRCVGETTLYEAALAGAVKPAFEFRHLGTAVADFTLGEVVFGLAGANSVPYEDFTTSQLGILGHGVDAEETVVYTARHRVPSGSGGARTLRIDLPPTFLPLAGTSLTKNGVVQVAPSMTNDGTELSLAWTLDVTEGDVLVATVPVAPGVYVGEHRADLEVSSAAARQTLEDVAPVRVTEAGEPNDDPSQATVLQPNVLHIGHAAGVDYFQLDVPADQLVDVVLNNRESGDNDLVVYHPANAAGVRPEDRLVATTSTDPVVLPLTETADGNRYGEPVAGGTAEDIPLLDLPVAAISDVRNQANERVTFRSLAVPGSNMSRYIIQVSSYMGHAANGPYTLYATTRPAPGVSAACPARTGVSSADRPDGARSLPQLAAGDKTLILVNEDRLSELYGRQQTEAFLAKVDLLAAHSKVLGKVVPLDASDTFRARMGVWDQNPCDPANANAVLRAGHDVIDALIASGGADIDHIVLLGGTEVLPKGFLPDATQTGNESQFLPELASLFSENNGLIGAGQHLATDDPWGAVEARQYGSRFVYPPVRAVGRLVETLDEMAVSIDHFLATDVNGTLSRATASTFGAYFMKDLATAVDEAIAAAQANATTSTARSLDASDNWTSSSLRAEIVDAADPADVISFHTHSNPFGAAAPGDPATPFRSNELDAAGAKLKGTVFMTVGCHTGTTVADVLLAGTRPEFGQAASRNGALFLGQTGYGLGLDGSLAYSERLMAYVAEEMGRVSTIGEAVVAAKQRYLAAGLRSPYDEKALAELNLFGLTMFDFGSTAAPAAPVSATTESAEDPISGLQTATVTIIPDLRLVTTDDGAFYEAATSPTLGLGETSVAPERPVMPRVDVDVTQDSGVARGAWTVARDYEIPETIDPVIAATSLSGATASPTEPAPSDVVYPVNPLSVSRFEHATGERQQLSLIPSQFASTGIAGGSTLGTSRNTAEETVAVFYGPEVLTDSTAPSITDVGAVMENGKVKFLLDVVDPESDIVRASVLFEDAAGVHYQELDEGANGEWSAESAFSGDDVLVEFRALNEQGLVGRAANKSFGFLAVEAPVPPVGVVARVVDSIPDVNGVYDANAKVELAGAGQSFEYSLNGAPWQPYAAPVPTPRPGSNVVDYRSSSGAVGVLLVEVADGAGPTIQIISPANGSEVVPGTVVTLDFTCTDPNGATCEAFVDGVGGYDDGDTFTVRPGTMVVLVEGVDGQGNPSSTSVTISGRYDFNGFLAPVQMDSLNVVKAGRTIPMKWQLRDANGYVRSLEVVDVISSAPVACDSKLRLNIDLELWTYTSGLMYSTTDEQYHFGWKTQSTWRGCRDFQLELDDGSVHRVSFKFT